MPRSLSQLLQWKLHQLKKEAMWGVVLKTTAATAFIPLPWNRSIHPSEFKGNLCLMTPGSVSSVVTCTSCRNLQCTVLHLIHLPPPQTSSSSCFFTSVSFFLWWDYHPSNWEETSMLGCHPSLFFLPHHQHMNNYWVVPVLLFFKEKIWSTLPFWFLALCRFI